MIARQTKIQLPFMRRVPVIYTVLITISLSFPIAFLLSNLSNSSYVALQQPCLSVNVTTPLNETTPAIEKEEVKEEQPKEFVNPDLNIKELQRDFKTWLDHLRKSGGENGVTTERIACRELEAKAQTCTYEGMICANVSRNPTDDVHRAKVYFVDDRQKDFTEVPSDHWCGYRHQSADPRYYSSRHWPPWENTVVPQQSCLEAFYRTSDSLFAGNPRIKWEKPLTIIHHDFLENDHNGHLASDTLWMLDAALFQESLNLTKKRPGHSVHRAKGDEDGMLWTDDFTLYLPQSRDQFVRQMTRDVNRLLYGLILRKDIRKLYPNLTDDELRKSPGVDDPQRLTAQIFEAFPELGNGGILFHTDLVNNDETDLVCAPRLSAGFKTGMTGIDERTCRELRTKAFDLYGVERSPMKRVGQIAFPQPPKSVLIIDRHFTRRIANADELYKGLKEKLEPRGVNVSYIKTDKIQSAEEFVRVYSSAGIIISPHGSQNMAQMWMQRYSALIEVMPVGYTEYSFHMLSIPCKTWFYEFHSSAIQKDREKYEEKCGDKAPHMFSPCIEYKSEDVWIKVDKIMPVILHALERLGYDTGSIWFEDMYS